MMWERPRLVILKVVKFRAADYGGDVAGILALNGDGLRTMALAPWECVSPAAREELNKRTARRLFPEGRSPEGAMAGLYLYISALDEAHKIAQDLNTPEGSFWHGIMHRQEPDAANASYWFRQVGKHPIFPALRQGALQYGYDAGSEWDPFGFIEFCESARVRPGSEEEAAAMRVQLLEWQLLFDYCARDGAREKTS